jgi:protein-L-isoaspartate(D-aspartate) O-methyltransferase
MTETYREQIEAMVNRQLEGRGLIDPVILDAMRTVPRHLFVAPGQQKFAYDDRPLRISCGQTISQPYIVAKMTEALLLKGGERVLEIGTGSGYAAAILAQIANRVVTIERHAALADEASKRLAELSYDNIKVVCADGTKGYVGEAPYDAIVVAAASPQVPEALTEQLAEGGRLVIPVGGRSFSQSLLRVTKEPDGALKQDDLGGVIFVPLIGAEGWER